MWERLAALEPADPSKGSNGAGQLEASLANMTAVLEQRNRLQVAATAFLPSLPPYKPASCLTLKPAMHMDNEAAHKFPERPFVTSDACRAG